MDARRIATRMRYGVLLIYVFALVMGMWSAMLGVQLAIDSSGLILAAAILIALTGWRTTFKWKRLHGRL